MRLLLAFTLVLLSFQSSYADPRPTYQMRGSETFLYDQDVDYFSRPILLERTSKTQWFHRVTFNVSEYTKYCVRWERQCVAYNDKGQCVRYEEVCAYYDYRVRPVEKRIELNFKKAAQLPDDQTELYEIWIQRDKPFSEGEDRVNSQLYEESVVAPVKIWKHDNYRYSIELK